MSHEYIYNNEKRSHLKQIYNEYKTREKNLL